MIRKFAALAALTVALLAAFAAPASAAVADRDSSTSPYGPRIQQPTTTIDNGGKWCVRRYFPGHSKYALIVRCVGYHR